MGVPHSGPPRSAPLKSWCSKGAHPEGPTVDLPIPQSWAGLQAGFLLPRCRPPLSLGVTATHAFSGLSLAPASLLAQEGSSVTICAPWDGTRTARPPQCLGLC